jgi:hypothetical protein
MSRQHRPQLRALGFCGADDSVHPHNLVILAQAFPLVEFGILFRPDKVGRPAVLRHIAFYFTQVVEIYFKHLSENSK